MVLSFMAVRVATYRLKYAMFYSQSDVDFNLLLGSKNSEQGRNSIEDSTDREPNALLSLLIRRLTAIIVTHLPSFWGLAISVFNGSFYKVFTCCNKAGQQYFL